MVCALCRAVLVEAAGWDPLFANDRYSDTFSHHQTAQSFQSSLGEKCFLCISFWSKFTPTERKTLLETPTLSETPGFTFMSVEGESYGSYEFSIRLSPSHSTLIDSKNDYSAFKMSPAKDEEEMLQVGHLESLQLSNSTKSPETLSLARAWIKDCTQNHPKCRSSSKNIKYPTRLLDSGPLDSADQSIIQLVETRDTAVEGPYMTLSHSWGKGPSFTLNKTSYPMLRDKLSLNEIPQSFQDAIFVSRQMGVRYLWIDAMCIFQDKDDLSDWSREASTMHEIYSNSMCNIVAGETPHSSHSLFNSRDPRMMISPFTTVTITGKKRPPGTCEDFTESYVISDKTFWAQVEGARINSRGWVLQERFMSPRSLHFGTEQLFWECREKDAAEVSPDGAHMDTSNKLFKSYYVEMQDHETAKHDALKGLENMTLREDGYSYWTTLVAKYSACDLSYPTDKLIAFSAITKQISAVYEDEYIAGISRRAFESQLLWYVDSDAGETSRYDTYVAPSWSWASVNGRVTTIELSKGEFHFEIRGSNLDYATEDRTGAVRGGWLRLKGALKRLKLLRLPASRGADRMWDVIVDGFQIDKDELMDPWRVLLDVQQDSFDEENRNGTLCYMAASEHRDAYGRSLIAFLLKVVDFREGTFERIGLIWLVGGSKRAIRNVLTSKASRRGTLPCIQFKKGYYTIDVL